MRALLLPAFALVFVLAGFALPEVVAAQDGPRVAQNDAPTGTRRRRRRRRRPPREATPEATTAPETPESNAADVTAAAEAAAPTDEDAATVGSLRRSNDLEFDARLVRGQRAGAGAVVLFNRGNRPLPPLTGERRGFTRATVVDVLGPEALERPARRPARTREGEGETRERRRRPRPARDESPREERR